MFGASDLKSEIEVAETSVECPVKDCKIIAPQRLWWNQQIAKKERGCAGDISLLRGFESSLAEGNAQFYKSVELLDDR
jgi:hypothetical protein